MTLKEIAALAGVSIGTVDRVIYKRGRVSPETKAKIEDIIERFQWTTNPLARSLKRRKPYRFCALLPSQSDDTGYWRQMLSGIQNAEKMIAQLGVESHIIEYDRHNSASFTNAAAGILQSRPDGLIIPPVIPESTLPFIADVQTEGIPYIFVDAAIAQMSPCCVIAQDPWKSGYFAAKMLRLAAAAPPYSQIPGRPFAVLVEYGGDYHLQKRRDGFLAYAREADMPVIVREYPDNGAEPSGQAIEDFLRAQNLRTQNSLAGLFVANVMVSRLAAAGAPFNFPVIGYDLTPENRRLLESGVITALISQRPEEQGRQALLNLYRAVVLEQHIPATIELPINIYFRENLPPA
ncbi:MAG: LacI family transcriptional regulator [Spirochaetaceae bacterium]|jgi:LacI family transcriptional regulator|nr:LacI family transcriptional regulator [Spirochaetaceae bacterium]